VRALIVGASGGLARALGRRLTRAGFALDLATRPEREDAVRQAFADELARGQARTVIAPDGYAALPVESAPEAVFFGSALFAPTPLVRESEASIADQIRVGLEAPIALTRRLLRMEGPTRRDFGYIGSTSAFAGFADTAVYCAVKHGLLGFVRAMNAEYAGTDFRFWLFSMGTMDTEMGRRLKAQDPTSFLDPDQVARRIVDAVADREGNLFEPEMVIRRRAIRFLGN
jgi:NAD(P)-dependent dehydrogenase (short-subunit alcohol dehydrogenase family)